MISTVIDSLSSEIGEVEKKVKELYEKQRQLENKLMPLDFKGKSTEEFLRAWGDRHYHLIETNQEYRAINHRWSQATSRLDSLRREKRIRDSH